MNVADVAPAVDRTRLPRVVRQRLRVRHEAARRGREEAGAPQRGRPAGPERRRRQGSSPSSGSVGRRNASLPNRRGSTPSARCSDELAAALDLADGFADLIRKQSTETLSEWLARGEASSDPDLRRFAEGIRRDEASVQAAVTETVEQRPRGGACEPAEDDQAADVRPGGVRAPAGAGAQRRLTERRRRRRCRDSRSRRHRKCGRTRNCHPGLSPEPVPWICHPKRSPQVLTASSIRNGRCRT